MFQKNAYLDYIDIYKKTILEYARETQNEEILSFLVESGCSLGNRYTKGIELMFDSISKGWTTLFKTLVKKGVPVTA